MRKLAMLLTAIALGAGLAGGASARVLGYEGTLTLDFIQPDLPTLPFTGGGVATVNGSAGRIPLSSLRLAGGITGSMADPNRTMVGFQGFRVAVHTEIKP